MTNKKNTNKTNNNVRTTKHVHKDNKKRNHTTSQKKAENKKVIHKKEKALDHTCPGCKAPIFFIPSLGKWKCEYCDNSYTLEELEKYNNASSKANNQDSQISELVQDDIYVSYKCENCGAEIIADETTSATFCVYCGNTAILRSKLSGQFKPDLIIPFKKEKRSAINAFKNLSNGRPFLPKDFNNETNIERIRGIYIPFWIYDVEINGNLEARAQRITSWRRGDIRYTKTDYYRVHRDGSAKYFKIPVDGSSRFDNDIMNSIEPFNYNEMVPYNHAYLSGFLAERYDIDGDTLIGDAVNRAVESTKYLFLNDIVGYNNKSIFSHSLRAKNVKRQYALFPVWMVNVKYKDKYYLFAMNGQTGEFIGDMPIDNKKVILWILIWGIGVFVTVLILAFIAFKMGVFL